MTVRQGYYCILQYRSVPEREEGLNVGIVVCEEGGGLRLRALNERELGRLFGATPEILLRVQRLLRSVGARLQRLSPEERTAKGLRHFGACEASRLVLLEPHSTGLEDLDQKTAQLFEELVTPPLEQPSQRMPDLTASATSRGGEAPPNRIMPLPRTMHLGVAPEPGGMRQKNAALGLLQPVEEMPWRQATRNRWPTG